MWYNVIYELIKKMITKILILVILKNYEYLNDLQSAVSLQSQTNTITYPSVANVISILIQHYPDVFSTWSQG